MQALDRTVGVAHCAANSAGFAQHMPRLQRLPQFKVRALILNFATEGEAELGLRLVPVFTQFEAMVTKVAQHIAEILPDISAAA